MSGNINSSSGKAIKLSDTALTRKEAIILLLQNSFSVNISSSDISMFEKLQYIKSNGSQYILTNIVPNNNMGLYAKLSSEDINNDLIYFGSNGSNSRFWIGNVSGSMYFGWNNITSNNRPSLSNNTIFKIKMNYLNDRKNVFNDTVIESNLSSLNSNSNPISIFAGNNGSIVYNSSISLYNLIITQGDQIVYNFILMLFRIHILIQIKDSIESFFFTLKNVNLLVIA